MIPRAVGAAAVLVALTGCGPAADDGATVLVIGDSVLAWNSLVASSVGHAISDATGKGTARFAVPGSGFLEATSYDPIGSTYVAGPWDWVVVNGGANDLSDACGCEAACAPVLDDLLTADGTGGEIARTVAQIRGDGAQVVLLGYYDAPRGGGPFSACDEELAELDRRTEALAASTRGVIFLDMASVINPDTSDHYDPDRVHPSAEGSQRIGIAIARAIQAAG